MHDLFSFYIFHNILSSFKIELIAIGMQDFGKEESYTLETAFFQSEMYDEALALDYITWMRVKVENPKVVLLMADDFGAC